MEKKCLMFIVSCLVLIAPALVFAETATPKKATEATKKNNARLLELLPFANTQDLEDATRGLVAPLPNDGVINNDKGEPVWDMRKFQFILDKEIESGKVTIQGKKESLSELVALLDKFDFWFNIVTP